MEGKKFYLLKLNQFGNQVLSEGFFRDSEQAAKHFGTKFSLGANFSGYVKYGDYTYTIAEAYEFCTT